MKCAERTGLGPNRTRLHTIKSGPVRSGSVRSGSVRSGPVRSSPFRRTSTGSCPDLDRTGSQALRLTVFDVHHRSRGLSSLSKFVVILRVRRNFRSPSSLLKSVVVLQVHRCYRSSLSRLLFLKPIISRAAEAGSWYWSTEPGQVGCIRTKSTSMPVQCQSKPK